MSFFLLLYNRLAESMPLKILKLLSPQAFRSGEDIARQLSISRASVHNAVREAQELGADIHAVRGRGYRLGYPYSWLDELELGRQVGQQGFSIQVHERIESTNSLLLAQAQQGALHKRVIATEMQFGGRGRRGRTWLAELGMGLTFSVLWRFQRPLTALSGLSLAVGLAVARSLRRIGAEVTVKWPNDLLFQGRKLAGILIETQGDMLAGATAVIGVGLNVDALPDLAKQAGVPVAALSDCLGRVLDRNDVMAAILQELDGVLQAFDQHGFAYFQTEWTNLHAYQGQDVSILGPGESVLRGRVLGVDETGALRLDSARGVQVIHSGEVSVRPCC